MAKAIGGRRWKMRMGAIALALGLLPIDREAAAATIAWDIRIEGCQEVPPNAISAQGSGALTYDTATNVLGYNISFSELTSPELMAHIHGPAPRGSDTGVLFDLGTGNPKVGTWTVPEASEADLLAGRLYVNIHSDNFPGGEIRGQIDDLGSCDEIFTDGFESPTRATVVEVQTGAVSGPVSLRRVVVTAIRGINTESLWVADTLAAADYNGIYVFRGAGAPSLPSGITVGALVDVTGNTTEFGSPGETLTEILATGIALRATASSFPVPLTGISAATLSSLTAGEPYEGVLVRLQNMRVAAHGSFDRVILQDTGGGTIVMDDFIYDFSAGAFPVGTNFGTVTGVMHVLFGERYLLPRSATDIVLTP